MLARGRRGTGAQGCRGSEEEDALRQTLGERSRPDGGTLAARRQSRLPPHGAHSGALSLCCRKAKQSGDGGVARAGSAHATPLATADPQEVEHTQPRGQPSSSAARVRALSTSQARCRVPSARVVQQLASRRAARRALATHLNPPAPAAPALLCEPLARAPSSRVRRSREHALPLCSIFRAHIHLMSMFLSLRNPAPHPPCGWWGGSGPCSVLFD